MSSTTQRNGRYTENSGNFTSAGSAVSMESFHASVDRDSRSGTARFQNKARCQPLLPIVTQTNKISKFEMPSEKRNTITYTGGEISNCDFALEVNSHRIPQTKS